MKSSSIKHLDYESKPLNEVLRGKRGNFGFYIPKLNSNGSARESIKLFTSQTKARSARLGVKCKLETLLLISHNADNDPPSVLKVIKVELL